jgi:hypothetical protein
MSYSILRTNGTVAATVPDGEYNNTSTSLTLVGQNFVGYGEYLQSDLVKIMENFAASQAPQSPSVGQLWFNTSNKKLSVYSSSTPATWKTLATVIAGTSLPTSALTAGDLFFNTITDQLSVYNGSTWALVGPVYTKAQGVTGAVPLTVTANTLNTYNTLSFKIGNIPFAIWNKDAEFQSDGNIAGFTTIKSGLNINSLYSGTTYHGTASNADALNNVPATNFVRKDQNETMAGNLAVKSDNGLWLGSALSLRITTEPLTRNVSIYNSEEGAEFTLVGTRASAPVTMLTADASSGLITVYANPTADLGIATKNYVDTNLTSLNNAQSAALTSNVGAINGTLGVLTGEINDVSSYAQNVNTIKSNIASPIFTGTPAAPTANAGTNTTQLATTAFVFEANAGVYNSLINVTTAITNDIVSNYAPLVSPTLSGTPSSVTAPVNTSNTQIATTAFVTTAVINANANVTVTLAAKSNIVSPTFTGAPKAPTAAVTVANTQIATTAFIHNLFPRGIVLMWSGAVVDIPTGWALCDGTNGTPNMVNRFAVGAGGTYTVGASGGGSAVTVSTAAAGAHNHTGVVSGTSLSINQMPPHTHDFYNVYAIWGDQPGNYNLVGGVPTYPGGASPAWYSGLKDVDGNFVTPYIYYQNATDGDYDGGAYAFKNRTLQNTGGDSQSHNHTISSDGTHSHSMSVPVVLPSYYAICYIMKTV